MMGVLSSKHCQQALQVGQRCQVWTQQRRGRTLAGREAVSVSGQDGLLQEDRSCVGVPRQSGC